MSKQLTNPRKIIKITSKRLKKENWNLNLTYEEALRNSEIISLADGQLLEFVRDLSGQLVPEDIIFNKKKEINRARKERKSKLILDKLYKELDDMIFLDGYVAVVFDSQKDFDSVTGRTSFVLNGHNYKRVIGTTGGVKKNTVMFCKEEFNKELNIKLENDRNKLVKVVPAKFEAYKALSASGSSKVTQPKGILVIKDPSVIVKDKVIRITDDGKGGFKVLHGVDYEAEKEFCDGCAMISPKLAEQWAIDLGLTKIVDGEVVADYIPSGFNTRWSYNKGMVFTFPFLEFAEQVAHEYMVEDAWGDMIDIREVDLILTTNMLKLWNAYDSIEDYVGKCNKNGYQLRVSKVCPKVLEKKRNMNYQYLQSYDLSDEDIKELCQETIDIVYNSLGEDWATTMLYANGKNIKPKTFSDMEDSIFKAMCIDKTVCGDKLLKTRVRNMLKRKMNDAKKGVIQVDGNYSIVSGDLYAQCQGMFGMEITGLFEAEEFYSKAWIDQGVYEVVAYRSPMTSHNNITKMKLITNKEIEKWYRYMTTCTVINCWDTTTDRMNGMD